MPPAIFHRFLIAALFATGLSACAATSPTTSPTSAPANTTMSKSDSPLRNTYWKLVTLHGKTVTTAAQQREAHIVFSAQNNRVSGSSGCNRMMGGFEESANHLKFKSLGGTRMACPAGMEQEAEFLQALQTVERYRIQGERLEVLDSKGAVVASFEAVALQ